MKTIIFFLYSASILLSAAMAFIYRKDLRSRKLSILTPYLLLVFIQELCLHIYVRRSPTASTGLMYNIYHPVTVLVFASLFYHMPITRKMRKLVLVLAAFYLILAVATFSFIEPITKLNGYLIVAAGFVISCYAIIFLLNYFNMDNSEEEKHWRPVILITIGILTFYPVIGISFAFHKQLLAYEATILGMKIYQLIPQVMSIFMYGCFARAFYLCKKRN
ncbi:MAG TPA: hypothetical protein VIZ28_14805 [Chitinophagaceae bacterium]